MPSPTKHILLIQYRPGKFDAKSKIMAGKDGLKMSVEHVYGDVGTGRTELPVSGSINYEVINKGTAVAYLFDGAIEILPGQNWVTTNVSGLPLIDQPNITFDGDYQRSRAAGDLVVPSITA